MGIREFDHTRAVLATAVATAILAGTAASGNAHVVIVGIAVIQAALIGGWVLGTAMPGRIGALIIAVAAAAGADSAVSAWPSSELSPLLAPLGLGIIAMFIHQLTRGVVRARVVESLSGIAVVLVASVALTSLAQLRNEYDGRAMTIAAVLAAGVGIGVGLLVDLVWSRPRFDPDVPRGLVAVVIGTVVGAFIGQLILRDSPVMEPGRALLLSAAVAALGSLASVGTSFLAHGLATQDSEPVSEFAVVHTPRPALRPIPVAVLPLALVAPAAYVLFLSVS
ncbi:MAG: conserved rane protein of unknown function [Pseudonocardiales bacterium]|nr:conserved rane protein of unknown function [Pseudonocardiales bacterium]